MSSRPVYIPSRKRSRQTAGGTTASGAPQRLHGAFEGGFSAGYYNTVGSQEGWEPTNEKNPTRQQKPEDYMDDQDFNEWGGPKTVRSEYQQENSASALATTSALPTSQKSLLEAMVIIKPPMNIGRQLLRVLGWRDGSNTAYVPSSAEAITTTAPSTSTNNAEDVHQNLSKLVLSQKKLRKIQLQQKRVQIPPSKNDTCGLGFVPYEDAPEFRAARERRQRLARERAIAAVQGSGRNVYRVSNLLTAGSDQPPSTTKDDPQDDPYNSYETTEDFVGSKSVGGFALREDDDDVYDDNMLVERDVPTLDRDQYDTVVYEHESDPEDDHVHKLSSTTKSATQDLSGLLSTWATGKSNETKADDTKKKLTSNTETSASLGLTADGRPQLPGFVLGTSSLPNQNVQRYPGPTIPANYEVRRHVFTLDHMASTLQVLSRAVQLEMVDERQRTALQDALEVNAAANAPARHRDTEKPMAGPTFSALAEAMKNRFRSSETQGTSDSTPNVVKAFEEQNNDKSTMDDKKEIKITRAVMTFVPSSLLCKRFHVTAPQGIAGAIETSGKMSEATYFQSEILNTAQSAQASKPDELKKTNDDPKIPSKKDAFKLFEDETNSTEAATIERPSMDVYKSIYEPGSESLSESEEAEVSIQEGKRETVTESGQPHVGSDNTPPLEIVQDETTSDFVAAQVEATLFESTKSDASLVDRRPKEETSLVPYQPTQKEQRKRHRKDSRRRSRSPSEEGSISSDDTSSEIEGRRRKRHRKDRKRDRRRRDDHKKKRRKKESKSDRKRERKSS